MSQDPRVRAALRDAERGVSDDASRLVAAVPALMREAGRRRNLAPAGPPSLTHLAVWAMPRLAAATAVSLLVAGWIMTNEKDAAATATSPTTPETFESVILDGPGAGTGDVVFDALLTVEGRDG